MRVQGQITTLKRNKDFNKGGNFTITEINKEGKITGQEYNVVIRPKHFLPIWEGDYIDTELKIEKGDYLIKGFPLVVISDEEEQLLQCVKKCSYKCIDKGKEDFFLLEMKSSQICKKSFSNVGQYMDFLAQNIYYYNNFPDKASKPAFPSFSGFKTEQTKNKKMSLFFSRWLNQRIFRQLYLIGLSKGDIKKMAQPQKYPSLVEMYQECLKNPYKIVNIPLEKCDEMYIAVNGELNLELRMGGEILRFLIEKQKNSNWTFVPDFFMLTKYPQYVEHIPMLEQVFELKFEDDRIYTGYSWTVETEVAGFLNEMLSREKIDFDPLELDQDSSLSAKQMEAVRYALENRVSIIKGGPGTGKSTLIAEIVKYLLTTDQTFFVGNAARNAKERIIKTTGRNEIIEDRVCTLDKIISRYNMGEKVNLNTLIVDEAFMVSSELFYRVITAIPNIGRIIFLGDSNQLPPINWGYLGESLLKADIPLFELTECFRVVSDDKEIHPIIVNSNILLDAVANRTIPAFKKGSNFNLIKGSIDKVYDLIKSFKKSNIDLDNFRVLCPQNAPLPSLNKLINSVYLSDNETITDKWEKEWVIGSIVMTTENYYGTKYQFANGEEGKIIDVSTEVVKNAAVGYVEVLFPGKNDPIKFYITDLEEVLGLHTTLSLAPASAKTVHKAQGSEYPLVVFYFPSVKFTASKYSFYNYKLSYTAITRTQNICIVIGDTNCFLTSCQKLPSRVYEHLHKRLPQKSEIEAASEPEDESFYPDNFDEEQEFDWYD